MNDIAQRETTFQQRKAAELAQERGAAPEQQMRDVTPPPGAPLDDQGTPPGEMGSEDETLDLSQEGLADEQLDEEYELEDSSGALDEDETPPGEDQDDESGSVDWEKRYNDLRSETQDLMDNRGGMEEEHAQLMGDTLQFKFQLEDLTKEASQRADFLLNVMTGNANQFRNIDWSQVPPDQIEVKQRQAQNAFMMEQQAKAAYDEAMQYQEQVRSEMKRREADIAKVRLKRSIPGWNNETYHALREFAVQKGMQVGEFNDLTNPVLIEALNAYRTMSEAGSTVQKRTVRKPQKQRVKNARRQPRNERGQFQRKQVEPNVRGSFAERHKHRLAAERQGQM